MRYRNLRGPISVQVEITEACNLDCIHCYNHWRDKSKPFCANNLDKVKMNRVVDSLIEAGVSSVTLTGGEPLLFWNILPAAIQKMISSGINVGLNSNLCLLTDEMATALKQSGLKHILVSVLCGKEEVHDSITGRKGSWQKTIDGIKKARKFDFRISSNTVLMKPNRPYLRETAKLMKELGVSSFCATKASPALNSRNFEDLILSRDELRDSLDELIKIKEEFKISVDILECYPLCLIGNIDKYSPFTRHSCTAGITTCTIGPSGDVRPCSHADMTYGNMFQTNLLDIWERMSDWRDCQYIPNECQTCKFIEQCSGGCRMEAKYRGNIKGRDPFMSGPENIKPQNAINKKYVPVLPEKLRINPRLKIREENFGATVSVPGKTLFVNTDAILILKELLNHQGFTVNFVAEKFGLKIEAINQFLHRLLQSGIIQKAH